MTDITTRPDPTMIRWDQAMYRERAQSAAADAKLGLSSSLLSADVISKIAQEVGDDVWEACIDHRLRWLCSVHNELEDAVRR